MRISPRPALRDIDPYQPGRHDADEDGLLSSNESPYGAGEMVRRAVIDSAGLLHRYPDSTATLLTAAIARRHDVDAAQVLVGNGSDELIYLLAWAFAANSGSVACADPSYRVDELSATVAGASMAKVPLVDWSHDLDAMAQVEADLVHVVNPHNPTGTALAAGAIASFVARCRSAIPIIDEAYIDYADDPEVRTAIPLAAEGKALVLRTFSKVFGLAGVRLGYLIGDARVLDELRKIRPPFSVGVVAQHAGLAALADVAHYEYARERIMANRRRLHDLLVAAGFDPIRSQANFILVPHVDEALFVAHMAAHGIAIRPGTSLGVRDAVRISVPGESGLSRFEAALQGIGERVRACGGGHR